MIIKLEVTDSDISMLIAGLMLRRNSYEQTKEELEESGEYPTVLQVVRSQSTQASSLIDLLDSELQEQNEKRMAKECEDYE